MKIKVCLLLLLPFFMSNMLVAQNFFSDTTIKTSKNKEDFIVSFKKNIVIDPENYNITIDYIEDNYRTLIFSGVAQGLGNLTATSIVTNAINGTLDFKIEMRYQENNEEWLFKPQKLVFTYKANRYSRFSHLPTSILEKMKSELEVIMIYGPQFVLDSYFFKRLSEYKNEQDSLLTVVNNTELKKKERKKAEREYESAAVKYKIYNDVYRAVESIMTRLKIYYLN